MDNESPQELPSTQDFSMTSTAFNSGENIPVQYCGEEVAGGGNVSVPLKWENTPEFTKSLLLVIVDPHPVAKNWIHWVVRDISPDTFALEESASGTNMPISSIELTGTEGIKGYRGPEPPVGSGDHPYEVHLFALDTDSIDLPDQPTWEQVQAATSEHAIGEAMITGYYGR